MDNAIAGPRRSGLAQCLAHRHRAGHPKPDWFADEREWP